MLEKDPAGQYEASTNEEREELREEGDQIKFIDFRYERRQRLENIEDLSCI